MESDGPVDVVEDCREVRCVGRVEMDGSVDVVGVKLSRVAGLDCTLGCCEGWVDTEVFVVTVE